MASKTDRLHAQALRFARQRLGPTAQVRWRPRDIGGLQTWAYNTEPSKSFVVGDSWEALIDKLKALPDPEKMMPDPKLMTCAAIAKHYGVATSTISNNVARAGLPVAARNGRRTLFDPEAVEKWFKTHQDRLKPRPGGRRPRHKNNPRPSPVKHGRLNLTVSATVLNQAERLVKRLAGTPFETSLSQLGERGLVLALREVENILK